MHQRHLVDTTQLLHLHGTAGKTLQWFSNDMQASFEKNQHKVDPYYLNLDINYNFNSAGYRTAEFDQYTPDQFFIAMGCSYTVGEGLLQADRWSDQLSVHTGLPDMNLGVSGAGIDVIMFNSINYVNSDLPKPQFVVIQLPEITRRVEWYRQQEAESTSVYCEIAADSDSEFEQFYNEISQSQASEIQITPAVNAAYYCEIIRHYWQSIGTPVYFWCFSGDADTVKPYTDQEVWSLPADYPDLIWPGDVARDCAHDGKESNATAAKIIHKHLMEKHHER